MYADGLGVPAAAGAPLLASVTNDSVCCMTMLPEYVCTSEFTSGPDNSCRFGAVPAVQQATKGGTNIDAHPGKTTVTCRYAAPHDDAVGTHEDCTVQAAAAAVNPRCLAKHTRQN